MSANIQARTTGIDWKDFGDVTLNTAAILFGERYTIVSGVVETRVEGREKIHKHKVMRVTHWTAVPLREDH